MCERRVVEYVRSIPVDTIFVLVADVGGTNSNFGLFAADNPGELLVSIHYKSKQVTDFDEIVLDAIAYVKTGYAIVVEKICIAAAGVVSEHADFVKPTNLPFSINKASLVKKTGVSNFVLVNDFVVIGYGIDLLKPGSVVCIQKGAVRPYANRAILGAGTGLGKSLMIWNDQLQLFESIPSEGGHGDCSVQDTVEFQAISYIKKQYKTEQDTVSWEDLLSGDGIKYTYQFFHAKDGMQYKGDEQPPHPDEIFNNRNKSESCQQTVQFYTRMYARCAKNYALDTLSLGGIYIAGGIAAKNMPLFQSELFLNEFSRCTKQHAVLQAIPVYVIVDYNVSLYGAAVYLCNY